MAENESHLKQVNDSEFEARRKYRYVDVMRKEVIFNLKDNEGLKQSELMTGEDMEQMLNAYLDEDGVWTLNLNSSFYAIGIPESLFSTYQVPDTMHWPTISHKIYGSTRLTWLLMKFNGVVGKNIFKAIPAGTVVKYLDRTKYVDLILGSIQENEGEING